MDKFPIFVTGRFRSGSTLLWNLFRSTGECTSYYEPCHDRLLEMLQYNKMADPSHVNAGSYWEEYLPIQKKLMEKHKAEFGAKRLLLEESDSHPQLEKHIDFLINAAEKTPVLQFNRIDFRLPWLRKRFKDARLIHLYRDPRDQWMSMAKNLPREAWDNPFENTQYDLLIWACSLAENFPFLFSNVIKTSYHLHYMLWRLSKLMGERCSDLSISFESLVDNPEESIAKLMDFAGLDKVDIGLLVSIVSPPERGIWNNVVDEEWFSSAEKECDVLLAHLGLTANFGRLKMEMILKKNKRKWSKYQSDSTSKATKALLDLFIENRRAEYSQFHIASLAYQTSKNMWNNHISNLKSLTAEFEPIKSMCDNLVERLQSLAAESKPIK